MSHKDYLGDGVYVELDEFGMIKLTTSDGINDTNTIYLEPDVFVSFERWCKRVRAEAANASE